MLKRFSLILCGLAVSVSTQAALISPQEALRRLDDAGLNFGATRSGMPARLLFTSDTPDGDAAVYVFETDGSGYVFLSADDAAAPLLGYSESGSFNATEIPPQMKWWLSEYGRQIEYARNVGAEAFVSAQDDTRKPVAPLLKTIWNQLAPYNNQVPTVNTKRCATGCVATAMAQVMKYWNYPAAGSGTVSITNPSTNKTETLNLSTVKFDWDNMLDSYEVKYNSVQADAVASLMKAVGYACRMNYGADESRSFNYLAAQALMENFGYNSLLQYCIRDYYSSVSWEEMIYAELSAGRPVLYGGQSPAGGHAFVCDGYSSGGYFHINWGWSGMSDGYYLLNALNPSVLGVGGGLGGGFNTSQEAIIGVAPQTVKAVAPNLVQFGPLSATASKLSLTLSLSENGQNHSWVNDGVADLTVALGVAIEPMTGSSPVTYLKIKEATVKKPTGEVKSDGMEMTMSYSGILGKVTADIPSSLADGRYRVTVLTNAEGWDVWTPVLTPPEYYNYIYITKKGNQLTVENLQDATVSIVSAKAISPLYYGYMVKLEIQVRNNSEKELTKDFTPQLYTNGVVKMIGDGVVLTIPAKTTVTREFVTEFSTVSGAEAPTDDTIYTLGWIETTYGTQYDYTTQVKMQTNPPSPECEIEKFTIKGAAETDYPLSNGSSVKVLKVEQADVIEADLRILNKGEFFGAPVYVAMFDYITLGTSLAMLPFYPAAILTAGESADMSATLDISALQLNHIYSLMVYLMTGGDWKQLGTDLLFTVATGAGVEDLVTDDDAPVKYFNLQGVEIKNPGRGMMLIEKRGGKTRKIIF